MAFDLMSLFGGGAAGEQASPEVLARLQQALPQSIDPAIAPLVAEASKLQGPTKSGATLGEVAAKQVADKAKPINLAPAAGLLEQALGSKGGTGAVRAPGTVQNGSAQQNPTLAPVSENTAGMALMQRLLQSKGLV